MRLPLVVALIGAASSAFGQVTVRGVAYDSLRNAPLASAFVTLGGNGVSKSATSDAEGRFRFDSVPPGAYAVSILHASIDSLGFPGFGARTTVTDGRAEIRIAIPSFASLWRAACGPSNPPRDSGFVYGVVRHASTQRPVGDASIDIRWVEMTIDKDMKVGQRLWRSQTRSDAGGSFGVCGIPSDGVVLVQASADSAESGAIEVATGGARIRRRDLYLGSAGDRGTIVGTLTGTAGSPFGDARVMLDSMAPVRSSADGRFTLRDVAIGTRQLVITAIGMEPLSLVVDVFSRDTAVVIAEIRKAATTLAPVNVKAIARRRQFERELDERRRTGLGSMRDSTQIKAMGTIASVFEGFAGATVRRSRSGTEFSVWFRAGTDQCLALVWLDGRRADFDQLSLIHPSEVALVEIYPRRAMVPPKFMVPGRGQACGAVVVWTKFSVP
jgi:hypothetical protein